ncbi:NAD-dependent epimerase/dehydratase family protein [Bradyrhizobium erythrophlei]|uniref:NAD-dependent epimerase/dehydratase family protein n=1 Tax=Bradyrhizobium erythrophlei TaxID=1437360 RepID=UPI0035E800C0
MKIFVAGATGAIGLPLVRALCTLGHQVTGMTRAGRGVDRLRELGAEEPRAADAFDPKAVRTAIEAASPDVVIDQLSSLPANPADILKSIPNDTRLHREGGGNLLAAAQELGVGRYILQSKGFYLDAPAGQLAHESAKLRYDAPGVIGESTRTIGAYEDRVLASPPLDGVVLRYGFFYGPGTWYRPGGAVADQLRKGEASIIGEGNANWSFVHIDDAIAATVASLTAEPGVYNIVDDDPLSVAEWLPAFARWVDAPEPPRVSVEDALKAAGAEAVYFHTRLTGAANSRAKAQLGFTPRPLLWKPHLRRGLKGA